LTTTTARPTGITILAILAAISGAFSILAGLGYVAGAPLIPAAAIGTVAADIAGPLKAIATVIGIFWLVVGIAQLAFAYGAWTLKPWAWMLGLVIEGSSILLTFIVGVMAGDLAATLTASLIPLAVAILIIAYLLSASVKTAFGRA
jgi:uncharacterized membrane protein HdeD (DUF308 family)